MASNNTFIQNVYYHYILSEPSLVTRFEPDFFSAKPVQYAFKLAKDYAVKYHQAPTVDQLKQLVIENNMQDVLQDDVIDVLYAQRQMLSQYTDEWLYDETTNWAILENVKKSIVDAAAYLKLNQDEMESGNAKQIVEHIKTMFNRSCVLEFSDDLETGSDFWDAENHKQKKLIRSSLGYDFIDFCLNGGGFSGALICFAGAPKTGKSLWLQNICVKSVEKGENNAYITLELPEEMVISRMGANMFSIPSLEYEKYTKDTIEFKEKITRYRKSKLIKPGALIIKDFPTSTLSVIELESYLLAKEEELSTEGHPFKFKNIFIDYLNIMKNYRNPNSENTYMKIKQIAEDLRAMGKKNGWCIITATQTNRSQFDTNDINASQISESAGLGATVDAMFGIIADALMLAQGKYYLKCIYDRVSPQANKKKLFDCNFNFLRISEDVTEGIIDTALISPVDSSNKFIKGAAKQRSKIDQKFAPGAVEKPADEPNQAHNLVDVVVPQAVKENTIASPFIKVKGQGLFDQNKTTV